jgi:hypothetical protein
MNVNEAIALAKKEAKDPYAQAYLKNIPESIEEFGSHGFNVQLLYVMSNLGTWKGENARNAKAVMKTYLKSKNMM